MLTNKQHKELNRPKAASIQEFRRSYQLGDDS